MKYFVSIVSHGHASYICNNIAMLEIAKLPNVTVLVKDNIHDLFLYNFCLSNDIVYLTSPEKMGFGENNNFVYRHCLENLNICADDYFLIVNPDVIVKSDMFLKMVEYVESYKYPLFTINLFKDHNLEVSEPSLREFPSLLNLVNLFMNIPVCKSYNKELLADGSEVDWASGAFLGFQSSLFHNVNGFDSRYFMYYEDVDICYRVKSCFNERVHFLKNIKAVHVGAYQNRNIFSKHFRWYIISLCKFLIKSKRNG